MKKIWVLPAICLLLASLAFPQSRETGAVRGVVTDDQGLPMPGVNVTLSSPNLMGLRTFVTDENGEYRFPALPPGVYKVQFELQGFGTTVREDIRLTTTATLTVDVQMRPAAVSEEITVVAKVPTVDVKSTETASVTLSDEILRNVPNNQFTAEIVNLAPGITNNVAYGGSESTGIAYSMDGVNVADPEAGSAWVFSDYNIIEEAKVMGIGLPAEYGNFTGAIFNLVTKSGGNAFSGHFEFDFQGYQQDSSFWQANNNQAYVDDFPNLTSPSSKLLDVNAHLGGPIVRDKLWFYVGGQFYRTKERPAGFPDDVDYKQPRVFAKLSAQPSPSLNVSLAFQTTQYQGTNRDAADWILPEATVTQDSPDWLISLTLTKILSPKTFFDLKTNYFEGRYYLDPTAGTVAVSRYSLNDDLLSGSSGYYYWADRARFGTNASLTHYVEDFLAGSHEFKFGAEFERSMARSRYGYTGTGGTLGNNVKYTDYVGYAYNLHGEYAYFSGPYLAYQYSGYDVNTRYTRLEVFAQDSWQVMKRLNISLGLRFSQNWGDVKGVSGVVYNTNRLAPRLGFTFDVLGDKSTILKAHYGQYTEAMLTSYHDRMNPAEKFGNKIGYWYDPLTSSWDPWYDIPHDPYTVASDIKHPYMTQFTVGLERELFKNASLGVTYINRKWNNLIGHYDTAGVYEPAEVYSPELDRTFTVYERTLATLDTYSYIITNLRQSDDLPYILENPYRKYEGIEILFNKRFSNRWQLLASYVYGRATGTIDNAFGEDIGAAWVSARSDPNTWINADGHLTNDPTHMIKIQGTYVLPFDISLTGYFWAITGEAWTTRILTEAFNQGQITFFTEERGSHHYPMEKILNLRLEKIFTLAKKYRLGLMFDVFNVFNDDTITSWGTRIGYDWFTSGVYPSTDGHRLRSISTPRNARLGVRFMF
ncbi:MAG TPA: TonB-dependent receptor [Candidatus Aminicenantes bacterium]|nr:TonB-dependent receptor [Candidatus Aminicenantes bacterium]HRY63783.1 TonB-dependent receptor [Candidatus Aminicenantes bacterium]HRZ70696.1 TonB-dependent receptor [Candidatus Aminicenantes bacterium]